MLQIVTKLIEIRFRKFLPPRDTVAIVLFICLYLFLSYVLNSKYELIQNFIFLFSIEIYTYHNNRNDLELLQLNKNYRWILFLEYLFYSLPFLSILVLHLNYIQFVVYLSLLVTYIYLPKTNGLKISYPFRLFDPFWHISFRKNKLWFVVPLPALLAYMGITHTNDNLILASFGLTAVLASSIFNNREPIQFIKATAFDPKKYLIKTIKSTAINTLFIVLPTIIVLLVFQKTALLVYIPLLLILPLQNLLLKYAYFENSLLQQIYFAFTLSSVIQIYLAPVFIMLLPFLYKKAITNLQLMHYASN